MRIWIRHYIIAATLVFTASPAFAAWHKAESDHFVIYADDKPKNIVRFSENLERYHKAMEVVVGVKVPKPSPSNRVVIFVAGSQRDIRRLAGGKSRNVAGFYIPRAGASRAFVQDIRMKSGYPHFSTVVLLHEYAHHFLISSSRFAMPRWWSEGAAEFFAAASFDADGGMMIGRPAQHRAGELAYADNVTVPELLDRELYEKNKGRRYDAFYGRSWLLWHFLTFEEERRGQMGKYSRAVMGGTPSIEAGRQAFGDLKQLEKDLKSYGRQRRMFTLTLKPEQLPIGPVTITRLAEGEAAMMEVRMRSQRGVTQEQAEELIIDAREVAAKYPNDPGVFTALAEAEYDADNYDAAIAAADKAIALDPSRTNAYVQKGFALFAKAAEAQEEAAAYKAAMTPFQKLNAMENDHPLPLIYFYRSFAERGKEPPENARHALERAAQLAPFDQSLWMQVAQMQMAEGKFELARQSVLPIANDPHASGLSAAAKEFLDLLDNLKSTEVADDQAVDAKAVLSVEEEE